MEHSRYICFSCSQCRSHPQYPGPLNLPKVNAKPGFDPVHSWIWPQTKQNHKVRSSSSAHIGYIHEYSILEPTKTLGKTFRWHLNNYSLLSVMVDQNPWGKGSTRTIDGTRIDSNKIEGHILFAC